MASVVVDRVNRMTASALSDYHQPQPKMLNDPVQVRPIIRILVLTLALAGFVVATVWVFHTQPVYHVETVITTSHKNEALDFGTDLLFEQPQDNQTILQVVCPCRGSTLIGVASKEEWSVFVNISLISLIQGKGEFSRADLSVFCNNSTACDSQCYDILRAAIPVCDWSSKAYRLDHHINSPNLLSLSSLVETVTSQIYLNQKFVDVEHDNQFFRFALESMLDQAKTNSSSSDLDFWTAAGSYRDQYGYNYALAMHIDWPAYAQLCSPQVCTAVTYVPPARRSLAALGLMGGYLSILKLALGAILWPAVVYLCRFPRWSPRKRSEKLDAATSSTVQPYEEPAV